ncbi:GLPGLI family protein [Flavobacterium frigidarium]|uniref:GLPGLI family protein n=1 Tax=Flavobacterium frigidarium TaxID=99286 RepID=A0ABV4KFL2_9FLAO
MKYLVSLLLLIPLFSFSQSFTIEYDVNVNFLNRKGILKFNKNENSFYSEKNNEVSDKEEKNQETGSLKKTFFLGGNNNNELRVQIYDQKKDTLFNIDYLVNEEVLCVEKFPVMQWQLMSEKKLISNFLCSKAITHFRGRNYIAWFAIELPIQIGPWKFNNLPGAILQVYDETNNYSWSTTKISTNLEDENFKIDKNLKKISLQNYIEQDEKLKKEISNTALLKFIQRGAEIVERKYERGREKEFEWE